MARIHGIPVFALSALLLFSWLGLSHCSKKPVGVARKEDIPYIKCQVCEKLAHQLHHQVLQKQAQISPKKAPVRRLNGVEQVLAKRGIGTCINLES